MQVEYLNNSVRKVCSDATVARKKYGVRMSELIHQRVAELKAADTVEEMIRFGIGRCHPLHGNREGQYALDLVHPHRLVFVKDREMMKVVCVTEIVDDYH